MTRRLGLGATVALLFATGLIVSAQSAALSKSKLRFEISFPASAHAEPITGRVYVMISRKHEPEPRLQIGRTGVPFFGRDVENLAPGQAVIIDDSDLGSPVESLSEIPSGEYFVQGFVNIYSEFTRADGYRVWMHDDQWEGQHWQRSPGNLHSAVERVPIDSARGGVITLSAATIIPPVVVPPDTEWVKRIKIQSEILTKFWGRPIYLGATLLLPRDYDRETISYPINYIQGHFSLNPPLNFEVGAELYKEWIQDTFPRMIVATLQHPNPYFDDSYGVNSANVGPYGDAIMQELYPEIEKRFRVIREPYARVTSGGSTGGWIALAHQFFYPDYYGGTWSYCPDSVTFSDVEGINVYKDLNAFYKQHEWRRVPIANTREVTGETRLTSEQRNRFELVNGTKGRSGEQLDIWSAVFGPVGSDGYFEPLFDKREGTINPDVAGYWREHYDLLAYLQRHWKTLGPKLIGKVHVYTGTADNFFLNNSTKELDNWMKATTEPHYPGVFVYGDGKGHCFSGMSTPAERLKEMAQHIQRHKPDGATTPWWRY